MSLTRLPCILFALERERLYLHDAIRIKDRFPDSPCPAFLCTDQSEHIIVMETGVGAIRTLRALDWLLGPPSREKIHGQFVLSAGFAGSLDSSTRVGDVMLARDVVNEEGATWAAPMRPGDLPGIRCGRLLTTSRFIGEPSEKLALGKQHGAIAVDMESAAFARRCHERGVPWACLRVISDDVSAAFSAEVAGLVEDGRVRMGRVVWLLARKPWLLPKLVRLAGQTRRAARRLADGVVQFLACSSNG